MYIERKIDHELLLWKLDPDRKPLIIKGARQVGKTASIRKFGKDNYEHFIEINFVTDPKYKAIISDGYSADSIIKKISFLNPGFRFVKGKTLLFFDEIQDFPELTTSLKFFKEDGKYDVICSGSLLGVNYNRIDSISVGYKKDITMRSMDFEEFLWANGYKEHIESLERHMYDFSPLSESEYYVWKQLFLDYCVLGGMPEVVKSYLEKGTFEKSLEIQKDIVDGYKADIRKYAEGIEQTRIINVFNRIVPQLGQDNKKFQVSKVASGARQKDYFGCIEWLVDAGIVNKCYCLTIPEKPLVGNSDESKYKLYFADSGLFISMLGEEEQDDIRANKSLGTYNGAVFESIIAEALVKQGYELFYYKREDSRLEEDFFIRVKNSIVPIEVKAGSNKSKTLSTLISSDYYKDITYGIKLADKNIGKENGIITYPHFCAFLIRRVMTRLEK